MRIILTSGAPATYRVSLLLIGIGLLFYSNTNERIIRSTVALGFIGGIDELFWYFSSPLLFTLVRPQNVVACVEGYAPQNNVVRSTRATMKGSQNLASTRNQGCHYPETTESEARVL